MVVVQVVVVVDVVQVVWVSVRMVVEVVVRGRGGSGGEEEVVQV